MPVGNYNLDVNNNNVICTIKIMTVYGNHVTVGVTM